MFRRFSTPGPGRLSQPKSIISTTAAAQPQRANLGLRPSSHTFPFFFLYSMMLRNMSEPSSATAFNGLNTMTESSAPQEATLMRKRQRSGSITTEDSNKTSSGCAACDETESLSKKRCKLSMDNREPENFNVSYILFRLKTL